MYTEDDLLPISALQHLAFCERQWALIHLERIWSDNRLTAEGKQMHEKTHSVGSEQRVGIRIARGLRLRSLHLGVWGVADIVEFRHLSPPEESPNGLTEKRTGVSLVNLPGLWRPVPVEYKRGRPKDGNCDEVQLCAQAICLEEMLNVSIREAELFYGKPRRRHRVTLTAKLRKDTEELSFRLHEMTELGITPPAVYTKRCDQCSLRSSCIPKSAGRGKSALTYLSRAIKASIEEAL